MKHISFSLYLGPPEFRTLSEHSYFLDNIVICISSIRICSLYNRSQLETLIVYQSFDRNVIFERDTHKHMWPDNLKLRLILLLFSHSVVSNSLWPHRLQPTRLLCPWGFPGKNIGVGCHFLLHFLRYTIWNIKRIAQPSLPSNTDDQHLWRVNIFCLDNSE